MNRLKEILASGRAPGFCQKAKDPLSADVAVPKAFKDLEQTESAGTIARKASLTVKQIRRAWNI